MINTYDIVIIGAGITGTAIARELSRYKLKIALLEKEEELAFGTSKSNSGIIHPGTQNSRHSLKGRLCVQGNALVRNIAEDLGVDFKETGELIVAFSEEELPRLEQLRKEAMALGVKGLRLVKPSWLRVHEPNLSREAIAALYAPSAGIISPYRLVYDLAENALKNGVAIYTESKVTNILPYAAAGRSQSRFEVMSSRNTFRARYVINAAGLYADEVAQMAGISDFRIRPRKGEEFILDKKRSNITNHLIFPLPSKNSKGIIVIKTADGNPMIGPTAQDCDDKEDLSTSEEGLNRVFSAAARMVPSVSQSDIIAYFAGLRPVAGDDFIIRGENKVPGFINVAGIQSPGLTAAPAIALLVCGLLCASGLQLEKKRLFYKRRKKTLHLFAIPLSGTAKLVKKDSAYGDIVCRCEMVSAKEVKEAIKRGAKTMDGIKFRTRAQAGRCHGSFCSTRIMKMLSVSLGKPLTAITKKGKGSEIVHAQTRHD